MNQSNDSRVDWTLALPNELIAQIFSYYPASDDQRYPKAKSPDDLIEYHGPPFWSTITHVCRRWREVSIGMPQLWSNIVLTNPASVEEMITRSKDIPITVKPQKTIYDNNSGPVLQALQHIRRICHLELTIFATTFGNISPVLMDNPAPLLEELSLSVIGTRQHHVIPAIWFNGALPRLTRLTLRMLKLPSTANILHSGLTELSLHYLDHFSETQFFDMLDHMPKLEALELAYSFPRIQNIDSDRTVSLPNIRRLNVLGVMSICAPIVVRFAIPADAKVYIEVVQLAHEDDPSFYGSALCRMVTQLCGKKRREESVVDTSRLTKLVIDDSRYNGLRFRQFKDDGSLPGTASFPVADDSRPHYDFSISWARTAIYPKKAATRLLTEICAELPLQPVRTLVVEGQYHVSGNRWERTFGQMKNVTDICVSGQVAYGFVEAFEARDVSHPAMDSSQTFVAPQSATVSQTPPRPPVPVIFPFAIHVRFESFGLDKESEDGGFPTFNSLRRGLLMRARARRSSLDNAESITAVFHGCMIARMQEENLRTIEGVRILVSGHEARREWSEKSEFATEHFDTDSETMDSDLED